MDEQERANGEPIEIVEEETRSAAEEPDLLSSVECGQWRTSAFNDQVPSLFLDKRLKILLANDSFCRLFGCRSQPSGIYFTQFFAPFFNEKKSSELFRAIISKESGYTWSGRVERIGMDQLMTISKVWVVPILSQASPTPRAYGVFCLDMTVEYRQLLQDTFSSLLGAARLKDNDTGNHIERVNRYARTLAEHLLGRPQWPEVDRQFVESIGQVSALHDIGKIGTPDDILNKAGPLEAWERTVMKQHTTNGYIILSTYPNPIARDIALRHHEWWDGTGYPYELVGDLIPLSARLVAFADVYDALRMPRSYKEAFTHERAVKIIDDENGSHFDPSLLEPFHAVADEFDRIFSELGDSA
jgi:HD-GYP domain-containing protein (c-di-GMP phosphodiesterase class II)